MTIKESWTRLKTWFEKKQPEYIEGLNHKGATNQEITAFEKIINDQLPDDFKLFYQQHNGWHSCFMPMIRHFQSLNKILETMDVLGDFPEFIRYVPFTISASARDYYALDLNHDGQVVFFNVEDDEVTIKAPSFRAWLARLVADLENGKYDDEYKMLND